MMFHQESLKGTLSLPLTIVVALLANVGVFAFQSFQPNSFKILQQHPKCNTNNNIEKLSKHITSTSESPHTTFMFDRISTVTQMNKEGMEGESQHYNIGGNFFDEIMDYNTDDDEDDDELLPDLFDAENEPFVPKINSVTLVGRVGQKPEPRYFGDNKVVLRLSLAVKRKYHPLERQARNIQSGEEETDWFNLELWGRDAEYASKYVTKGARIGVTGSLNVDTWEDRITGEQRSGHKIVVKHLDILESRAEAELRMGNRGNYSGNQGGNDNNEGGFDYGGGGNYNGPSAGGFFDN